MLNVSKELIQFCKTNKEQLVIELALEGLSSRKIASRMDIAKTSILRMIKRVKDRASLQGFAPDNDMTKVAPDTHFVKGTSTLYKNDKPVLQWVKTDKKAEDQFKVMQAVVEALKEDIKPCKAVALNESNHNSKLLNAYTITDFHYGMMAWGEESGADWDLTIAEETLMNWFRAAIEQSPKSETAILANIGDALHQDSIEAVTPSSKHSLDSSDRFQKIVRSMINVIRNIIAMLLEKHKHVHVINATGNHDISSSIWLRELFAMYYADEPRVTVEQSPDVYYAYEFGNTSLFWHHGHKRGVDNVSSVFAAKFREIFGRTKYSYAHLGHKHSVDVKENNLMIVEQHQTLAAPDAYASSGGWLSQRSAQCITYHKDYGEVSRVRITPEMLK